MSESISIIAFSNSHSPLRLGVYSLTSPPGIYSGRIRNPCLGPRISHIIFTSPLTGEGRANMQEVSAHFPVVNALKCVFQ